MLSIGHYYCLYVELSARMVEWKRVHAGVVLLLLGLVGLVFHYSGHVTDLRVCGGVWGGRGGGTALSLFLAHYIFINNIIAVFIISATTIFI